MDPGGPTREEFEALVKRVEQLEAGRRRTGPPLDQRTSRTLVLTTAVLHGREADEGAFAVTTDTASLWRYASGAWIPWPLPECDRCNRQATVAIGIENAHLIGYACDEHSLDAFDFADRAAEQRRKTSVQRRQLEAGA